MLFRARIMHAQKGAQDITVEALDVAHAREQLVGRGDVVLSLLPARRNRLPSITFHRHFDLELFTQELITLLNAGLSLGEALATLAQDSHSELRQPIEKLLERLQQGQPFSAALAEQAGIFPPLYCATVRSAEETGDLATALTRHLSYTRQIGQLKKQLISALIYPAILIGAGSLVILFLLLYVVPRFATVYQNAGRTPPWTTELLLRLGDTLTHHSALLVTGGLGLVIGILVAFKRPATRARIEQTLWGLPGLGEPLRIFHLARLFRSVGMLLEGGIPMLTALHVASGLAGFALKAGIGATQDALKNGQSVADAFRAGGLSTAVAYRLLQVGEKSGNMATAMESIARIYDESTARRLSWVTHLFEPLLMVSIGLTVGLIVVLLYTPIFDLTGAFQ